MMKKLWFYELSKNELSDGTYLRFYTLKDGEFTICQKFSRHYRVNMSYDQVVTQLLIRLSGELMKSYGKNELEEQLLKFREYFLKDNAVIEIILHDGLQKGGETK